MIGLHVLPASIYDVLSLLYSMSQGIVATGYDTYHATVRHAEGGWQFACVEHPQPSAGACTYIEEPSAMIHALLHSFYKRLYLWNGAPHGLGHKCIFIVDMIEQLAHRHLFQMVVVRWLFRDFLRS